MIRKGKLYEVSSEKMQVGDILHLKEDQEVPCDVIVLSTSHSQVSSEDTNYINLKFVCKMKLKLQNS